MVIAKSFNLDINTPWKAPTLYIKQGDVDSRKLQATIRKDGTNYTIPGDVFATFRMHKPDDTFVTQDCTISGSVVSVVMDAQCATAAGHGKAEFVLQTASEVVSTFLLAIEILPYAVSDGDIESRDALGEYRTILEEMLRVKGAPLVANTAADMTDTDRVYVYTGSEVGYVNGSWYYYDGAAWTLGGVYNSQAIGLAYQQEVAQMVKQSAVASESDSTPYLYRPTPNPSAILADEEIVGGTIAWNQLIPAANFSATGGTISTDANYVATFTASASGQQAYRSAGLLKDHVIIAAITYKTTTASTDVKMRVFTRDINGIASTDWQTIYAMNKQIVTGTASIGVVDRRASGWDAINVKNAMYIDLTAMFGSTIADYLYTLESGTAGAGVAKLREWGFLSKEYFAHDAGSLVSVNTSGKRVTGFNLFDKSTVSDGYINDASGNFTPSAMAQATDYIEVIPGVSYFIDSDQTGGGWGAWYDADKNYISGITYYTVGASDAQKTKTAPTNAHFMRLTVVYNDSGNIDTCCVSVANPATNHIRKPYRQPITYLTTPTDLNGIFYLDADDRLRTKGDVYHANGTIDRIYHADVIDGGANLTVASVPQHSSGYYYCAIGISSAYTAANNTNLFNDGGYSAASGVVPGHIYEASGGSMIVVVLFDQTITTAAAANTYFASHPLHIVYELASAKQTTETADPYPETQIVGKGGTERWIDDRAVPVPVGHRTTYYIGVPDVPANANAATLKATVSGGKTTLSWS